MITTEMDALDIELLWLTRVEQGNDEVAEIRSLANRVSQGDMIKKEAFIMGYLAHQLVGAQMLLGATEANAGTMSTEQPSLFD